MIISKQDLRNYIKEDRTRQGIKHPILARLTYGPNYQIRSYLTNLRKLEYYTNCGKGIWDKIMYSYYLLRHRRMSQKYGIYISPNSVGKGFVMPHPGFIRIGSLCHIGKNCTVLPMVLMGKKKPGIKGTIKIGDNCYISTGVSIIGPITIGDNVTIGAGAVVVSDIPSNCIVAGVPARIVKRL